MNPAHHVSQITNPDGSHRGYQCSCGFTASTGDRTRDAQFLNRHSPTMPSESEPHQPETGNPEPGTSHAFRPRLDEATGSSRAREEVPVIRPEILDRSPVRLGIGDQLASRHLKPGEPLALAAELGASAALFHHRAPGLQPALVLVLLADVQPLT